jgi:hypothetical protein
MSDRLNRTSICSVIFINIVDYGQAAVDDQIALKSRFNALINEAVKDVAQNDRIILDTGDGAAIALLGAPEEALFVALTIRDGVMQDKQQYPERFFSIRAGINLGPVRVVNDLNGMLNVLGDGINAAQRVMSFAQPNAILVSRSYYEIASRLSTEIGAMFTYYGVKTDKYVREHEIYVVQNGQAEAQVIPEEPVEVEGQAARLLAACRKRWVPATASIALLALVWGIWVSMPPSADANEGNVAEKGRKSEAQADSAQTMPEGKAATLEKSGAKQTKTASRPVRHKRASDQASAQQEPAGAQQSKQTQSSVQEGKSSVLCSDAQRMLKQCN